MDREFRDRQFWVRVVLFGGLLWGLLPLITLPLVLRGTNDSIFEVFAALMNSFTVLPACSMAFRRRRGACLWLSVNAVMAATALAIYLRSDRLANPEAMIGLAGSIVLAGILDFMELSRWPGALER